MLVLIHNVRLPIESICKQGPLTQGGGGKQVCNVVEVASSFHIPFKRRTQGHMF